ncbi:hypothetical protein EMPG_10180 [Blastomyces silverae]|uniref:Uncharacterized protein n=1 Tax=Blastomyces silverae TaxID=2060906 RepID=A0A0H1B4S1_9EURO|nr:hypothetical protein EMPG_10180 [Blastomyces silverae]
MYNALLKKGTPLDFFKRKRRKQRPFIRLSTQPEGLAEQGGLRPPTAAGRGLVCHANNTAKRRDEKIQSELTVFPVSASFMQAKIPGTWRPDDDDTNMPEQWKWVVLFLIDFLSPGAQKKLEGTFHVDHENAARSSTQGTRLLHLLRSESFLLAPCAMACRIWG